MEQAEEVKDGLFTVRIETLIIEDTDEVILCNMGPLKDKYCQCLIQDKFDKS